MIETWNLEFCIWERNVKFHPPWLHVFRLSHLSLKRGSCHEFHSEKMGRFGYSGYSKRILIFLLWRHNTLGKRISGTGNANAYVGGIRLSCTEVYTRYYHLRKRWQPVTREKQHRLGWITPHFFRIKIILPKRPHFFIAKTARLIFLSTQTMISCVISCNSRFVQ
jgi:hypothetical protein